MLKRMSPFDWLQIALGFIYYVRRIIMACSSLLACRPEPQSVVSDELAEGAD
jgi:hypothetical protein